MTKIDIVSGFLGAGKTTFIQKMLKEALNGEKVVLIENEFGEIGIDGGFLKDAGIEIREMNSGCICCSLVGDFGTSLKEVIKTYAPERILIEPSGVGKLSDVIKAVADIESGKDDMKDVTLNSAVAVVDVSKCKMYIKNFGEFFLNQIESAGTIILSRTQNVSEEKLAEAVAMIKEHNAKATIITTPWDRIDGKLILTTIEGGKTLEEELMEEVLKHHDDDDEECCCHHHHHHDDDDDDDEECCCHHHHDDDDDDDEECCCHHHHDDDDDDGEEHHHHHHHHDDDDDDDGEEHHHHHHHHHHHADDVFTSWGFETPKTYTSEEISAILDKLTDEASYGIILRAKGMVSDKNGEFIYFDYVPEEKNVRPGSPEVTGKICVIGSKINEDNLKALFGV